MILNIDPKVDYVFKKLFGRESQSIPALQAEKSVTALPKEWQR